MKLATIVLWLLLALSAVHGQSDPVLIDEFGNPNCEDIWARLDGFAVQLNSNMKATGTVAISGKVNELQGDLYFDAMIRGYFRRHGMHGRVKVLRTSIESDRRIAFWLAPPGAAPPPIRESQWSLVYPAETSAFIFTHDENYMETVSVCLPVDEIALLADVLEANPDAKTNVVLKVTSNSRFLRRKQKVLRELLDYGIKKDRIRFFKVIDRRPNPYGIRPTAEYWFVP